MRLTGFDADLFLRDYWQKRPLLIRNAWDGWANPLDPDDLAGLACEEDVEARLVMRNDDYWSVEFGPFAEDRFGTLGHAPWTLLVQAVDQHVDAVAALLASFRFIPNWRIDDVMVSYATDGGGVGPHFDQYDVFLIQGLGQRRWYIGGRCDGSTGLRPHDDLRLLARFDAVEDWVLEPGDMLYLPPGIAHDGVAVGDDCMTYSIGFRAPSRSELVAHWCDHLLAGMDDYDRYADPHLSAQANPGEIAPAALADLHAMILSAMQDRTAFARWFGQHSSTPKYPELVDAPDRPLTPAMLRRRLAGGAALRPNSASRFSFTRQDGATLLFVDGALVDCDRETAPVAEQLCAGDIVTLNDDALASDAVVALLVGLVNRGSLLVDG